MSVGSAHGPDAGAASPARSAGHPCPLCLSDRTRPLARVHGRRYFACDVCRLAFMATADRPAAAAERARYEEHRNDPSDAGYREWLRKVVEPLVARLEPGAEGLDYGAGPGPTLSVMMREAGFPTTDWDPFFAADDAALERTYDFIACTETAEHFFDPARELERLDRLLRPGGWLALMTQLRDASHPFEGWWYVRDPTHVCFYAESTLAWIAERFGWRLERPAPTVALYRKERA